jgi:hypothetical protein
MRPKETMIAYLKHKVEIEDWHGVWDAAVELQVMAALEAATEDGSLDRILVQAQRLNQLCEAPEPPRTAIGDGLAELNLRINALGGTDER